MGKVLCGVSFCFLIMIFDHEAGENLPKNESPFIFMISFFNEYF